MRLPVLTLLAVWSASVAASGPHVDESTGLATWQVETRGIQLRLTQISPNQVRGFYQARGFPAAAANEYARECIFMTVVRNVGDMPLEHRLSDWHYVVAGHAPQAIRSKAEWDARWTRLGVTEGARIAFTWAQFPTEQTFAPGDWNQGMTAFSAPRESSFDLHFIWRIGDTRYSDVLKEIHCAKDA
ncbi:MAG: hypothetical protein R6W97_10575 [Thiobacillus sp.]